MTTKTIMGHEIPVDPQGRVNLTHLFKLAGSPRGKEPSRYKRRKQAKALMAMAEWYATRGRYAASWAWGVIVIDYYQYIGLKVYVDLEVAARDAARREEARREHEEQESRRQKAAEDAEAARRFAEELKEKTLRQLEEMKARQSRQQEAHEQGFESYREYDPDRPEDEDDGVDHGDDWMDQGAESRSEPTMDTVPEFSAGLDHDFMDFIVSGPQGRPIRASMN